MPDYCRLEALVDLPGVRKEASQGTKDTLNVITSRSTGKALMTFFHPLSFTWHVHTSFLLLEMIAVSSGHFSE